MTDQWQSFRFLVWPFIVGSAATQCMYIMLWLLAGTRLKREHAVACIAAGAVALLFAFSVTLHWDNSSFYWIAFTIGLCVLAGVQITSAGLLIARIWKR
jgi:putative flippase GtrA